MFTLLASHDANGENGLDVTEDEVDGDDEKDVEPSLLHVLVAKIQTLLVLLPLLHMLKAFEK